MKLSWGSDHVEVGYQRNPEEEPRRINKAGNDCLNELNASPREKQFFDNRGGGGRLRRFEWRSCGHLWDDKQVEIDAQAQVGGELRAAQRVQRI